jgi:hypothetical protein
MTWWRRNLIALLALVVLVPATVFVSSGLSFLDFRSNNPVPVEVKPGARLTEFGRTWSVRVAKEFPSTGTNGIPKGSALVAAVIGMTPGATAADHPIACGDVELRAPGSESRERSWPVLDRSVAEGYEYRFAGTTVTDCPTGATKPALFEVVFLTPVDTIEGSGVVLRLSEHRRPVLIRLDLHQG